MKQFLLLSNVESNTGVAKLARSFGDRQSRKSWRLSLRANRTLFFRTILTLLSSCFCPLFFWTKAFPQVLSIPATDQPSFTKQVAEPKASDHQLELAVRSQLVVPETNVTRARLPVVDVHTHFFAKGKHDPDLLKRYVEMMDRNNVAVSVSLDGTLLTLLNEHCKFLWTDYKDRFVIFANIDFQGNGTVDRPESWACNQPDFVRRVVGSLKEASQRKLISGLKFFKDFGLLYRNSDGTLISIDDPRWDPIWQTCGELGLSIL